jgi:hypothetical protein
MKRSHLLFVVYIIMMFTTFFVSAAGIQKWVDADGNTHYGDIPPIGNSSEQVRVNSSSNGGGIRPEEKRKPGQVESKEIHNRYSHESNTGRDRY